jgi:hypothetical protein
MKPEASPEPPSSGLVSWNQAGVQLIALVHRDSREFFWAQSNPPTCEYCVPSVSAPKSHYHSHLPRTNSTV